MSALPCNALVFTNHWFSSSAGIMSQACKGAVEEVLQGHRLTLAASKLKCLYDSSTQNRGQRAATATELLNSPVFSYGVCVCVCARAL